MCDLFLVNFRIHRLFSVSKCGFAISKISTDKYKKDLIQSVFFWNLLLSVFKICGFSSLDEASASEYSSSHIVFSSTNVEIDSAKMKQALDFETSLSCDESSFLETFESVECDEDVATLIVTFARANIDRYCFCCPLMGVNKSFEQAETFTYCFIN